LCQYHLPPGLQQGLQIMMAIECCIGMDEIDAIFQQLWLYITQGIVNFIV
jgi:hypothetical protein